MGVRWGKVGGEEKENAEEIERSTRRADSFRFLPLSLSLTRFIPIEDWPKLVRSLFAVHNETGKLASDSSPSPSSVASTDLPSLCHKSTSTPTSFPPLSSFSPFLTSSTPHLSPQLHHQQRSIPSSCSSFFSRRSRFVSSSPSLSLASTRRDPDLLPFALTVSLLLSDLASFRWMCDQEILPHLRLRRLLGDQL